MPDPLPTRLTEPGRPAQFYVREKEGDPLFGPLDFNSMDRQAREESSTNDSRMAQVVILFGTRTGDPPGFNPPMEMVKYVYIDGRRLGGSRTGLAGRIRRYVEVFTLTTEDDVLLLTEDEESLITGGLLTP